MGRIQRLPQGLRETIDRLLAEGVPQTEIRAQLEPLLARIGEAPLSAAGLNRYAAKWEGIDVRIRAARAIAAAWRDRHGERPETELGQVMVQTVQTFAFELTQRLGSGETEPAELLAMLKDLSLLVERLERAAEIGTRRERELRTLAAQAVGAAAKRLGLTADTAAQLRAAAEGPER